MTLRSDFLDDCARYSLKNLVTRMVLVGPMDEENLRKAIEDPARKAGLTVESALTRQSTRRLEQRRVLTASSAVRPMEALADRRRDGHAYPRGIQQVRKVRVERSRQRRIQRVCHGRRSPTGCKATHSALSQTGYSSAWCSLTDNRASQNKASHCTNFFQRKRREKTSPQRKT